METNYGMKLVTIYPLNKIKLKLFNLEIALIYSPIDNIFRLELVDELPCFVSVAVEDQREALPLQGCQQAIRRPGLWWGRGRFGGYLSFTRSI